MESSGNWVVDNIVNALNTWNGKLAEIWQLVTQSPQSFKGGSVWKVIEGIHGSLMAIGLALLVLFFVMGIMKSTMNLTELKRPEQAVRFFLRFVLAKTAVTYGMDIMLAIFKICQGVMNAATARFGSLSAATASLPDVVKQKIVGVGFWESIPLWAVTILGSLFVTVLSFVMIMSVYGRFFRLYTYTALAPIPLSTFAGEGTSSVGVHFLKSYAGVCLESAVIVIACLIFTAFSSSAPASINENMSATNIVWSYIGETIFSMLILVGAIKMSDRVCKEMMGL
jgi:hypothetical protein